MRAVNIMNFVRQCEPRDKYLDSILLETTAREIELVKEYNLPNTFLLQYDAIIDPAFVELFKRERDENMEIGLWLEIVQPLCEKVGLPWRSKRGWKWDWHVVPGFSMAYTPHERELLIDEAMNRFKEKFGFYPRTIGSWLIDTHTVNYLAENYEIDAICICRDEVNTDAYTLVGGYFNGAYYPSKKNMFTPAQTPENQVNVPVIRLLGPDPIHNYDSDRYLLEKTRGVFTLEVCSEHGGKSAPITKWYFDNYFSNEDLGFSYIQLGQENSFGYHDIIEPLRMQLELLKKYDNVTVQKMCDTGKYFKETYTGLTPATAVSAMSDWALDDDIQTAYYDSARYTANIMRYKNRIFIRCIYLFDENIPEYYLDVACETWDALYENLPVVDTLIWDRQNKDTCGMTLDKNGSPFEIEKLSEGVLAVSWNDKKVIFREGSIEIIGCNANVNLGSPEAKISVSEKKSEYEYKGNSYGFSLSSGRMKKTDIGYDITPDKDKIVIEL